MARLDDNRGIKKRCHSSIFMLMLKALKSCHDEQLFIWSSKTATVGENLDPTGEEFPSGYGIEFGDGFYMMMVIYEYVDTELIDNSGKKHTASTMEDSFLIVRAS